jgi:tetratricopeptide (TPR) repeat protein
MKQVRQGALVLSTVLLSTVSVFAQKKNETNAAMDYNSFEKALATENYDGAKRSIVSAKSFIDLAIENPETKESVKTLYFKGKIHLGYATLSALSEDNELAAIVNEDFIKEGVNAMKTAYTLDVKGRYRDEINMMALLGRDQSIRAGVTKFQEENYAEAIEYFKTSIQLLDVVGKTDSLAIYNLALAADRSSDYQTAFTYYDKAAQISYNVPTSYVLASSALRELDKNQEALEYVTKARVKYPNDQGLIIQMVNISLSSGDHATAEKSLNDAIAKDPENKQLFFAVGTVYEQLNKNEEAVKAYEKAIQIDPAYEDAVYSLGAHYVNLAAAQFETASKMKLGDPEYDALKNSSEENYKKAIPYLERALELNETSKEVMETLFQLYRKIGDTPKALEYKKRIDALK